MMRRATWLVFTLPMVAAVIVSWPTNPAAAKGPLPVIEVPDEGLRVGQPTIVPVNFEWDTPDGLPPRGVPSDFWGDEPPWSVFVGLENADLSTFEPLLLRHVGDDRYEVEFTPPQAGRWVLAAGVGGVPETGGRPTLLEDTKVSFDAALPATSRTWVLWPALAVAVAGGAVAVLARFGRSNFTRSERRLSAGTDAFRG